MSDRVMPARVLGSSGLEVSAIGYGAMGLSQSYGVAEESESEATLHGVLDAGVTFIDTANAYGNGHNEELIGRVLAGRRDEYVLATKFGISRESDNGLDGNPANVAGYCDASLERLKTDVIDLYYLHRVDPRFPLEETVGAMADLVSGGKVKALGLSEVSSDSLRRANGIHPIAAVQSEYSLWTRDVEKRLLATTDELDVALVPFSPLGRGFLTGTVQDAGFGKGDMRKRFPRFQGENFDRNRELVTQLAELAAGIGATPGQVSLAWLLAQGAHVVPIPGTKKTSRVDENAGAATVDLSAGIVAQLDAMFAPTLVAGDRYPEAMMGTVQTDD